MENVQDIIKGFREARVTGEKMMQEGKLTRGAYVFTMLGFETKLRAMGVQL